MVQLVTASGPRSVASWGYQLQGNQDSGEELDARSLLEAPHDLQVMDFSRDGLDSGRYRAEDIEALKARSASSVVIAYMSIGEASDYRSHWRKSWTSNGLATGKPTDAAPSWLGPNNTAWQNSCKVRYWEQSWQDVIFNDSRTGWLDLIAAQGFDGAYLDIVDAYYFWGSDDSKTARRAGDPENERDAARRMIEFIATFAAHVRERYPAFLILPQNGEMILDALGDPAALAEEDKARKAMFLGAVSAIGVEDVFCPGDKPEDNAVKPVVSRIDVLRRDFLGNAKPVFSVDYLDEEALMERYAGLCSGAGFVPYAAPRRNLDRLGPAFTGDVAPVAVATRSAGRIDGPVSDAARRSLLTPRLRWHGGRSA